MKKYSKRKLRLKKEKLKPVTLVVVEPETKHIGRRRANARKTAAPENKLASTPAENKDLLEGTGKPYLEITEDDGNAVVTTEGVDDSASGSCTEE